MTQKLVENLRKFNRKERFYLIGMALGNQDFAISKEFTSLLQDTFKESGINFHDRRFAAMDYHIDWIYASLLLSSEATTTATIVDGVCCYPRDKYERCITATQQDIDFLMAFGDKSNSSLTHLIMLEAKGATGWKNSQLSAKAKRLKAIFDCDGGKKRKDIVLPHFAIMSPKKPSYCLNVKGFPEFMVPNGDLLWLEMPMPEGLQKITRCDDNARKNQHGNFWKVE